MVPGDDDHLTAGTEPCANRPQHGLGDLHRLLLATLHQFHGVAEQDESLYAVDRVQQSPQGLGSREHAVAQPPAEVEIRDNEGPHTAPR